MKKLLLIAVGLFLCVNASAQQAEFGLTAGYANVTGKSSNSTTNIETSVGASGFYVGALADFSLSANFHLQPSVNLMIAEDSNFLLVPIMAKYYISDSEFYLQAGPQANVILEDTMDLFNTLGLDLAFGAGYEINENFFIEARYAFELTNRVTEELENSIENLGGASGSSVKFNTFTAGIGYKF